MFIFTDVSSTEAPDNTVATDLTTQADDTTVERFVSTAKVMVHIQDVYLDQAEAEEMIINTLGDPLYFSIN